MLLYCFDIDTKEKLLLSGYKYIAETNVNSKNAYVFEDNKKLTFNNLNVIRTNKMYF